MRPKWSEAALVRHSQRACDCCIHLTREDLEDEVIREAWDNCPTSGCIWRFCDECEARMAARLEQLERVR